MTTGELSPAPPGSSPLIRVALRRHRRDLVLGTILGGVHQVCEVLVAVVIGATIDRAISTGDASAMLRWGLAVVVLFVVLALAAAFGYYRLDRATQWIAHDVRLRVVDRALDPRGPRHPVATGEVLSLSTSDAARVGDAGQVVAGGVLAMIAIVTGLVVLVSASWLLAVVIIIGLPIVVLASGRLARPLEARSEHEQEAVADASAVAADLLVGLRVLKGFGAEAQGVARYRTVSQASRTARVHAARWSGVHESVALGMAAVFVVAIAWIGGRLALTGTITVGQLIAAVGVGSLLVGPITQLLALPGEWAVVHASKRRVDAFCHADFAVPETSGSATALAMPLVFDAVSSGPLRAVGIEVAEGEWVGVVAADRRDSGALVDVLARRVDPDAGLVTLGGVDIRTVALDALRAHVVVADHDGVLFAGTIDDNVDVAPPLDRRAVLAATTVDEVVDAIGGPLRSIGERGQRLSGGQRQRVALARAVASDASLLVLHDPTTAVDAVTEADIAGQVRELRRGRSTIVVTTSPAWLAVCDRVIQIEHGRQVGEGHHHARLSDEGYRRAVLS